MIAVDTNLVVRLLVQDDKVQGELARQVFAREQVFIAKSVLLETEWVLRHAYKLERPAVLKALRAITGLDSVVVEGAIAITEALDGFEQGLDFADALHRASGAQASCMVSFDRRFIVRSGAIAGLSVLHPESLLLN